MVHLGYIISQAAVLFINVMVLTGGLIQMLNDRLHWKYARMEDAHKGISPRKNPNKVSEFTHRLNTFTALLIILRSIDPAHNLGIYQPWVVDLFAYNIVGNHFLQGVVILYHTTSVNYTLSHSVIPKWLLVILVVSVLVVYITGAVCIALHAVTNRLVFTFLPFMVSGTYMLAVLAFCMDLALWILYQHTVEVRNGLKSLVGTGGRIPIQNEQLTNGLKKMLKLLLFLHILVMILIVAQVIVSHDIVAKNEMDEVGDPDDFDVNLLIFLYLETAGVILWMWYTWLPLTGIRKGISGGMTTSSSEMVKQNSTSVNPPPAKMSI